MRANPGINLIGFASGGLGLGVSVRMLADLLIERGIPFCILCMRTPRTPAAPQEDFEKYKPYFSRAPRHEINLFVFGVNFAKHLFPELRQIADSAGRFNVVLPFWELNKYPDVFLALKQEIQMFIAPSRFIQYGLLRELDQVYVDYAPVALLPPPIADTGSRSDHSTFQFFFNFDINSSIDRKNPGLLIRAFAELFGGDRNTELLLKVNGLNNPGAPAIMAKLQDLASRANVRVLSTFMPREQMLATISRADCYVSCHRSEGLGLGLLEAMSMGVPCIATGFGGNTDFMHNGNSVLLRYDMEPVTCAIYRGILGKEDVWAAPRKDDLKAAMLQVRRDEVLRRRLSSNGRRDALKYISQSWDSPILDMIFAAYRRDRVASS